MGWPAAGGSPLAADPPLLTPHGWNFGLPLPAVPGERHGFHFPQSPKRLSLSMLYVRSLCSSAGSPPPSVGGGGSWQPAATRSAATG